MIDFSKTNYPFPLWGVLGPYTVVLRAYSMLYSQTTLGRSWRTYAVLRIEWGWLLARHETTLLCSPSTLFSLS